MRRVWVAYYSDKSGLVIFDEEIDCLRHAVENSMKVSEVTLGESVWEQLDI